MILAVTLLLCAFWLVVTLGGGAEWMVRATTREREARAARSRRVSEVRQAREQERLLVAEAERWLSGGGR